MDGSPEPDGPAGTAPPGDCLPIGASFLKATPGGLINLRVHVSDELAFDSAFAADGWDVVRAGPLSVRLKLEA